MSAVIKMTSDKILTTIEVITMSAVIKMTTDKTLTTIGYNDVRSNKDDHF